MSRRILTGVVVSALFLGVAIAGFSLVAPSPVAAVIDDLSGSSQISVGQSGVIRITAARDVEHAQVTVLAGRSRQQRHVAFTDGQGTLIIGPPTTQTVGTITVLGPGSSGQIKHDLIVEPSQNVDAVELFVSGRTLRQGQDASAIVVVSDRFGNPVADDTPVEVVASGPTAQVETLTAWTANGRAEVQLLIAALPGQTTVVATAGDVRSAADTVVRLTGPPQDIELRLVPAGLGSSDAALRADGTSRIVFTSDVVVDTNGIALPTGTAVSLTIVSPDSVGYLTGYVQDGRVSAVMIAPDTPRSVTVTPTIQGITGSPFQVQFDSAIQPFTYDIAPTTRGAIVEVGPVVGWHGGLVEDGTPAQVGDLTVALVDGSARVVVADADKDPTVTVLGIQGITP